MDKTIRVVEGSHDRSVERGLLKSACRLFACMPRLPLSMAVVGHRMLVQRDMGMSFLGPYWLYKGCMRNGYFTASEGPFLQTVTGDTLRWKVFSR